MPFRIALLGIYHESNTFIRKPTTIDDFRNGHWLSGTDIIKEYEHAHHEIGGMIEVLRQHHADIIPVTFAEATPGGAITEDTIDTLLKQMFEELGKVVPLHGCLVIPHGAAVSESHDDMDGYWLSLIRQRLGPIPIIGTLDPHANVSEAMTKATDALISYKTNPHLDQRETGKIAAKLLLDTLNGKIKPSQVLLQSPVVISIEQQHTESDPCKSLYSFTRELEKGRIVSVSVNLGFPYADVYEMGTSFIIVSDDDKAEAMHAAELLNDYMIRNRKAFSTRSKTIEDILPELVHMRKPVLLLDMGDNVGGGAPGNSIYLLRALDKAPTLPYRKGEARWGSSFICLWEPQVVSQLSQHKDQHDVQLTLGANETGSQLTVTAKIIRSTDGKFSEPDPRHGGQVNYDMGKTFIVETIHGNTIMLHTKRVPPFSLQQLISAGIDPQAYDIIVAKGVNAPIAAYGPVCQTIIKVNTPGETQADMTRFAFKKRRKPLYPFEEIPALNIGEK